MSNCIFCKIAAGEIPSTKVYEDDRVLAFRDLEPQAPDHVLVIPKAHRTSLLDLRAEDGDLVAHIHMAVIPQIVSKLGLMEKGFRLVTNTGADGGQTVSHLHFHILGGRSMGWPPG